MACIDLFFELLEDVSTTWVLAAAAAVLSVVGLALGGDPRDPLVFAGFIFAALMAVVVWSTADDFREVIAMAAGVFSFGIGAIVLTDSSASTMPGAHLGELWLALGIGWLVITGDLFMEKFLSDYERRFYKTRIERWSPVVAGTGIWLVVAFAVIFRTLDMTLDGVIPAAILAIGYCLMRDKVRRDYGVGQTVS